MQKKSLRIVSVIFMVMGAVFVGISILLAVLIMKMNVDTANIFLLPTIFGGVGGIFLLLGIIFLVVIKSSHSKKDRLIANGNFVYATVTAIEYNRYVTVNHVHPHYILCQYQDAATGMTYEFRSENIYYRPDVAMGSTIRVYVDENNWKKYNVDIDSAEKNIAVY